MWWAGDGEEPGKHGDAHGEARGDEHKERAAQRRERHRDAPDQAQAHGARGDEAHGGEQLLPKPERTRREDAQQRGGEHADGGGQRLFEHVGQEAPPHPRAIGLEREHELGKPMQKKLMSVMVMGWKG